MIINSWDQQKEKGKNEHKIFVLPNQKSFHFLGKERKVLYSLKNWKFDIIVISHKAGER